MTYGARQFVRLLEPAMSAGPDAAGRQRLCCGCS